MSLKMHLQIFITLTVLVCFSQQIAKIVDCPKDRVIDSVYKDDCALIRCDESGELAVLECGLVSCYPRKAIPGDNTKVYPDCCYSCEE